MGRIDAALSTSTEKSIGMGGRRPDPLLADDGPGVRRRGLVDDRHDGDRGRAQGDALGVGQRARDGGAGRRGRDGHEAGDQPDGDDRSCETTDDRARRTHGYDLEMGVAGNASASRSPVRSLAGWPPATHVGPGARRSRRPSREQWRATVSTVALDCVDPSGSYHSRARQTASRPRAPEVIVGSFTPTRLSPVSCPGSSGSGWPSRHSPASSSWGGISRSAKTSGHSSPPTRPGSLRISNRTTSIGRPSR